MMAARRAHGVPLYHPGSVGTLFPRACTFVRHPSCENSVTTYPDWLEWMPATPPEVEGWWTPVRDAAFWSATSLHQGASTLWRFATDQAVNWYHVLRYTDWWREWERLRPLDESRTVMRYRMLSARYEDDDDDDDDDGDDGNGDDGDHNGNNHGNPEHKHVRDCETAILNDDDDGDNNGDQWVVFRAPERNGSSGANPK